MNQRTNYAFAVARIRACNTIDDVRRLETSLMRVYNAGCLSVSEYGRLDARLMERLAAIENGPNE